MRPDMKVVSAFSIIALAAILSGAKTGDSCSPTPPANCYADDCMHCYCLGPENYQVNAPVNPKTCNGDFVLSLSGFYWKAQEDGLEYAIRNKVIGSDGLTANANMNNLIDSQFLNPNFSWDFGFKLGIAYNTSCDGWDIGGIWTRFHNGASDDQEAEFDDNQTILPIWSAYQYPNAGTAPILFATDVRTFWKLDLNLFDIDLGREFWTSKYLSVRPHVGLRVAFIDQDFDIEYKGGSWIDAGSNDYYNGQIELENDFKGVGVRAGLDSTWNLGCGWGIYGNLAGSIVYGRFGIDQNEYLRQAFAPFSKITISESSDHFRASRSMLDMGLGVQWSAMFSECSYGLTLQLGWEHHYFFHQNQLWRAVRLGGTDETGIRNTSGENVYDQRRGSLSTQGWTLSGSFKF